jgi:hypothetical protein
MGKLTPLQQENKERRRSGNTTYCIPMWKKKHTAATGVAILVNKSYIKG